MRLRPNRERFQSIEPRHTGRLELVEAMTPEPDSSPDSSFQAAEASRPRPPPTESLVGAQLHRETAAPSDPVAEIEALRDALAARDEEALELATLRQALVEAHQKIASLSAIAAERDAMVASTSWRITRPLRTLITLVRGIRSLDRRVWDLAARSRSAQSGLAQPASTRSEPSGELDYLGSARDRAASALTQLAPLPIYPDPGPSGAGRLNLILDRLGRGSLYGSDASAILLSAALARNAGLRLRVITRRTEPEPTAFGAVLTAHGLAYSDNVDFEFCPPRGDAPGLAIADDDLIVTTSWWTTRAALKTFNPSRIVYLVGEDERRFDASDTRQKHFRGLFQEPGLRFVIATARLREDLISGGMAGVAAKSVVLEPAFPRSIYRRDPETKPAFLFFAEPGTPNRLVRTAIDGIRKVIARDIRYFERLELRLVGEGLPQLDLPAAIDSTSGERLTLQELGALIRRVDAALVLAPPDSFLYPVSPTWDLAAAGAVVVTNSEPSRLPLPNCGNVLCGGSALDDIGSLIDQAIDLAKNESKRLVNYRTSPIERDWEIVLAPVVDWLRAS